HSRVTAYSLLLTPYFSLLTSHCRSRLLLLLLGYLVQEAALSWGETPHSLLADLVEHSVDFGRDRLGIGPPAWPESGRQRGAPLRLGRAGLDHNHPLERAGRRVGAPASQGVKPEEEITEEHSTHVGEVGNSIIEVERSQDVEADQDGNEGPSPHRNRDREENQLRVRPVSGKGQSDTQHRARSTHERGDVHEAGEPHREASRP